MTRFEKTIEFVATPEATEQPFVIKFRAARDWSVAALITETVFVTEMFLSEKVTVGVFVTVIVPPLFRLVTGLVTLTSQGVVFAVLPGWTVKALALALVTGSETVLVCM